MFPASNKTRLIQGLVNPITCLAANAKKTLVALADSGKECGMVAWDVLSCQVSHMWLDPHFSGTSALAFSTEGDVIASLSLRDTVGASQFIRLFRIGVDSAIASVVVSEDHVHDSLLFNPWNNNEILTCGKSQVLFWEWRYDTLVKYHPVLVTSDFKCILREYTQSLFLRNSAITATIDGNVVVWQSEAIGDSSVAQRRAVKVVKLCNHTEPTILTHVNRLFAMGCSDGGVRVFDEELRIVAWFESIDLGGIRSLVFSEGVGVPHFHVVTDTAKLARVSPIDGTARTLVNAFGSPISGLSAIGEANLLVLTTAKALHLCDITELSTKRSIVFEKAATSALGTSAHVIAVGFTSGLLLIFDIRGDQVGSVKVSAGLVSNVVFDMDSAKSLVAVVEGILYLIAEDPSDGWKGVWDLRAHEGNVTGVGWLPGFRLFTLGTDKMIVETIGSISGGKIIRKIRVTENNVPLGLRLKPDSIDVIDSGFKIRTMSIAKNGELQTKRVRLMPLFYNPSHSLLNRPAHAILTAGQVSAFASGGYVGLIRDQGEFFGVIAQPTLSPVLIAFAGDRLFTAGDCGFLSEFKINDNLAPHYVPLYSAISDELEREARELFCLCQIKSKGENSAVGRRLDNKLVFEGLGEALNGLGYFPSEWEIRNMAKEVGSDYLSFETFMRLFINYRPVVELSPGTAVATIKQRGMVMEEALALGKMGFALRSEVSAALQRLALADPDFFN